MKRTSKGVPRSRQKSLKTPGGCFWIEATTTVNRLTYPFRRQVEISQLKTFFKSPASLLSALINSSSFARTVATPFAI
jgi:hypothetical protein